MGNPEKSHRADKKAICGRKKLIIVQRVNNPPKIVKNTL
jgi:hypothetical protein